MLTLPKITLVTPVFNCAEHIAETLDSVLRQDYPDLEYIVVDGGSTDGTLEIIRRFEARTDYQQHISCIISEPDKGMYDAVSKGFERASGEIFCYLNSDDLFECGGLKSVGEFFAQHPKVHVIYHEDIVYVDGWKYPNVRQPKDVDTVDLLNGHVLFQDGVFWRRNAYDTIGGFSRDFQLAGDFDLWLRLSAHFRFVKLTGHVSCFRMRSGQLSGDMDRYRNEMQVSVNNFMAATSAFKRLQWTIQKFLRRVSRNYSKKLHHDRFFFPIDFINMPPPKVVIPLKIGEIPRSPIDGKPAERFLFSTPDTRFGMQEINYIYLDSRHGIAITHPLIALEKLDKLYRDNYSSPPTELQKPQSSSPYRLFNGKSSWEKVLLWFPIEKIARLGKRIFRYTLIGQPTKSVGGFSSSAWSDNTLIELTKVLQKTGVEVTMPLRFLDTGCFDGKLLDQICEKTPWKAFGLEPNDHSVEEVRAKGHTVWHGHAHNAREIIPKSQKFDVIFMGQSIEHLDNPVFVLQRLRLLLAPGGVLVVSTPNLDSREIGWFGPTWAHWHAPYHRYIFSKKGLFALAKQVGLSPVYFESFSHPFWTAMSITNNLMGLGGSASHVISFDVSVSTLANRIHIWKILFWNRIGMGDYIFLAMRENLNE